MWLIPIIFVLLLISGTAFAYLMGAVSVVTFVAVDKTQFLSILPQRIFAQLDVFAFMAMPLFILTAEIMSRAGVTRSLIDFAMAIVGSLSRRSGTCEHPDKRVLCGYLRLCDCR